MEMRKKTVLYTVFTVLVVLAGTSFYHAAQEPNAIAIDIGEYPSIGSGDIELVVFEDLCCVNCRTFSEEIFPQIAAKFLETGRAKLTVIPVAFGEDSKPIANAALAVYKRAPHRFIPFVLELFKSKAADRDQMLVAAEKVGGIDLEDLAKSIDFHLYYNELDGNLTWARRLMGQEFGTPTLFVNGILTSTSSFEALTSRIRQMEKQK